MSDTKKAKSGSGALRKKLREEHAESVKRTQEHLKEQKAFRKPLQEALKDVPMTVPELAAITGQPSHEVLWHVTAMKRRGIVIETDKDGEYYRYQLAAGGTS